MMRGIFGVVATCLVVDLAPTYAAHPKLVHRRKVLREVTSNSLAVRKARSMSGSGIESGSGSNNKGDGDGSDAIGKITFAQDQTADQISASIAAAQKGNSDAPAIAVYQVSTVLKETTCAEVAESAAGSANFKTLRSVSLNFHSCM